jgi:hypothetical protein
MAAAGFYAELLVSATTGMNETKIVECLPWQACLGKCEENIKNQLLSDSDASITQSSRESCVGSVGSEACTEGYEGVRCSLCVQYDDEGEECDSNGETSIPNGYYRMNQRCEPCPCTWMTFGVVVFMFLALMLIFFFLVDRLPPEASEQASAAVGPILIIIT